MGKKHEAEKDILTVSTLSTSNNDHVNNNHDNNTNNNKNNISKQQQQQQLPISPMSDADQLPLFPLKTNFKFIYFEGEIYTLKHKVEPQSTAFGVYDPISKTYARLDIEKEKE